MFVAKPAEGLVDFAVAPKENTGDCPKLVEVVVEGTFVLGVPNDMIGILGCKVDD